MKTSKITERKNSRDEDRSKDRTGGGERYGRRVKNSRRKRNSRRRRQRRIRRFLLLLLFLIAGGIFLFFFYKKKSGEHADNPPITATEIDFSIDQLCNSDAKFYGEDVITTIDGSMVVYDALGQLQASFADIYANWVAVCEEDGTICYSNFDNEVGILKLDENLQCQSDEIVMTADHLNIDPTIRKYGDTYYMTLTDIDGNVNNADPDQQNGRYTINIYESENLSYWTLTGAVTAAWNNLEDVDFTIYQGIFYITYEKEVIDEGSSGIYMKYSKDRGKTWTQEFELLAQDADHEPAVLIRDGSEWLLYYSTCLDDPSLGYQQGKAYYAEYDDDFQLISKDNLIQTETRSGILLYDVKRRDGEGYLLYARNYLTDCDLVVEKEK